MQCPVPWGGLFVEWVMCVNKSACCSLLEQYWNDGASAPAAALQCHTLVYVGFCRWISFGCALLWCVQLKNGWNVPQLMFELATGTTFIGTLAVVLVDVLFCSTWACSSDEPWFMVGRFIVMWLQSYVKARNWEINVRIHHLYKYGEGVRQRFLSLGIF